jgi:hypothetical protein
MKKLIVAIAFLGCSVQSPVAPAASPLVGTSLNGTPLADQFAGVDMCAKISAAIASLGTAGGIVDATHFTGTQACASDPSSGVTVPVVVEVGNVTMQLSVPWNIHSSLFKWHGSGPGHSGIQYVGAGSVTAIITFGESAPTSPSANFTNTQFEGFHIWGSTSVTDAIALQGVHHSQFRDLSIWNVNGCGIHTRFAVTDTFANIHVTIFDAEKFGMLTSATATPAHGLCFDQYATNYTTTDGTVIDSEVEGVSGSGWYLPAAATMHFSAGTSESNGRGIEVGQSSFSNTFTNSDLESNTQDILDNGSNQVYVNPLSTDSVEFGANARHDMIVGGTLNSLTIDSGAAAITYAQTSIGNNGGTVTDSGTGGNNSAYAGSAALSLPGTNNAAIVTDPVSDLFAHYYFAAGSTQQFGQALAVNAGQPWRALFIGYWANNYEGGGLNVPAEITEVTSTSPLLNIGSIQLAFSINSSGHLQATNGSASYAAVFTGHVIVLPETSMSSAGTHSINVTGTVSAAAIETTNGTPASSTAACEPRSMWTDASYIYVCVSSNTIRRVALSAF